MDSNMDSAGSNSPTPLRSVNFPIIKNGFEGIKNSFEAISTEFMKMEHMPAYDQGATILTKLEQLNTTLGALQASQNQLQASHNQLQASHNQLQASHNQLQASHNQFQLDTASNFALVEMRLQTLHITQYNAASRARNSAAMSLDDPLSPFLDINTGQAILNFPSTFRQLEGLTSATLIQILGALGLETAGDLLERKYRLQQYIGLLGIGEDRHCAVAKTDSEGY